MHTPAETLAMIREAIKDLRDDLAANAAAREQIDPQIAQHLAEIEKLKHERVVLLHDSEQIGISIAAHERAESVFIEHSTPEPVPTDSEPGLDVPEAMPEGTNTEPETEPVKDEAKGHDPSKVHSRQIKHKRQSPTKQGIKRPRIVDGNEPQNPRIDLNDLSERVRWRADLVFDLLREHGALSQYQIAVLLSGPDMLNCKLGTAQSNVSEALQVLQHERKVMFTGLKVPTRPGGRKDSPEWKIRSTPQEHSSAGIPEDDDAQPKTTKWPSGGRAPKRGSHIRVESGGFETKRGKH